MILAAPDTRAALIAHYAAVRARLDPPAMPPHGVGSAWHVDTDADDAAHIRAVLAITAVVALEQGAPPTIAQIKRAACRVFGVTREDVDSPSRARRLAAARHIAMALARRVTSQSLPEIGRRFGGRDHSTVRYAVEKWDTAVTRALD
jgi:chromosomal replication initiator protein